MQSESTSKPSEAAESDRLLSFVSAVTDYAIYALSPDGIIRTWNAGAQRFKGYAPEEIVGQHFSAFYTREDRLAGVPDRALRIAREEGKFEDEGWRVRKDGSCFWATVVIDAIRDEDGTLIGYAKITRDITDRKLAAERLHASEERFRLLVQGVTDYAIYMLSPEGHITNWNAGAKRIKGFEEHEVVSTHFSRFYTQEDAASGLPMRALATAVREGRSESEGWRVRKDGSRFWAHVVIDPITDQAGELLGFAKVTRDITERRQAADDLQRATEALFHSQKLEAIGKLTGGVAHDFNNLLSVIVNGLGILQRKLHEPEDARVLDAMVRAAGRGATLTQQLLSFARQQPLKQEDRDLNEVITSFEPVLRRASTGPVDFRVTLAASLPPVRVDAGQFEAALLNLIVNARDATRDGGSIIVGTESVDLAAGQVGRLDAGSYVRVSVQDSGTGMSRDVAAKAIEPFFTTKPLGQGTGLGLSQAYGLAQQSKGDLAIETAPGEGATISLYFPAVVASDDPKPVKSGAHDKALVVDDQDDVREMAMALFSSLGYEVLSASNGSDALDILRSTPEIDVLFSDVVMPGMSGMKLAKEARALIPGLKIILASGYAPQALTEGTDIFDYGFISKPYTLAQILKQLRTATAAPA
ncbi:MAG: hybrid sensor histidine kinase/response regulator [Massilia sp.]|jgi:PAS domain S-box-containing protein|nr:hybrid sensor histidine kinase/response regulator [Massilia sp.]MDB5949664.1 hybrid sensor histidine kinase/response regulator [Massilia sp.]